MNAINVFITKTEEGHVAIAITDGANTHKLTCSSVFVDVSRQFPNPLTLDGPVVVWQDGV